MFLTVGRGGLIVASPPPVFTLAVCGGLLPPFICALYTVALAGPQLTDL